MKNYTVYDKTTGEVKRSGLADRPEWHLGENEAVLIGQRIPIGYRIVDGERVPMKLKPPPAMPNLPCVPPEPPEPETSE